MSRKCWADGRRILCDLDSAGLQRIALATVSFTRRPSSSTSTRYQGNLDAWQQRGADVYLFLPQIEPTKISNRHHQTALFPLNLPTSEWPYANLRLVLSQVLPIGNNLRSDALVPRIKLCLRRSCGPEVCLYNKSSRRISSIYCPSSQQLCLRLLLHFTFY